MKFTLSLVAVLAALLGDALAHFEIKYPAARGPVKYNQMNQPICGGYNDVGTRTAYPLKEGKIQVSPGHHATMWAEIAFNDNPTSFGQFNTTSDGKSYKNLVDFNNVDEAPVCWNVDISSLGVDVAKNGTNATILIFYDGGDGSLYQCADIVLSDTATIPAANITTSCKTVPQASTTATSPASSQTGTSGAMSLSLKGDWVVGSTAVVFLVLAFL